MHNSDVVPSGIPRPVISNLGVEAVFSTLYQNGISEIRAHHQELQYVEGANTAAEESTMDMVDPDGKIAAAGKYT